MVRHFLASFRAIPVTGHRVVPKRATSERFVEEPPTGDQSRSGLAMGPRTIRPAQRSGERHWFGGATWGQVRPILSKLGGLARTFAAGAWACSGHDGFTPESTPQRFVETMRPHADTAA